MSFYFRKLLRSLSGPCSASTGRSIISSPPNGSLLPRLIRHRDLILLAPGPEGFLLSLMLEAVPCLQQVLCCEELFETTVGPLSPEHITHPAVFTGQVGFHECEDERLTQIKIVLVGDLYHLIPIHLLVADLVDASHLRLEEYLACPGIEVGGVGAIGCGPHKKKSIFDIAEAYPSHLFSFRLTIPCTVGPRQTSGLTIRENS